MDEEVDACAPAPWPFFWRHCFPAKAPRAPPAPLRLPLGTDGQADEEGRDVGLSQLSCAHPIPSDGMIQPNADHMPRPPSPDPGSLLRVDILQWLPWALDRAG